MIKVWVVMLSFILTGLLFGSSMRAIDKIQEARIAETAREMVSNEEWIIPHYNGEVRLQKPPLTYWTTSLSFKIFSVNEFSARIPSLIFSLMTALLLFVWLKREVNLRAAVNAVIVLMSTFIGMRYFRSAEADTTLAFFICLAGFSGFYFIEAYRRLHVWIFMLSLGLGFLTKGPAAIAIPLLTIVIYSLLMKKIARCKSLLNPIGIAILLFSAFAWYVWIFINMPDMAQGFFSKQVDETFVTGNHKQPIYWYLIHFFDFFAPWSLLALPAVIWYKNNQSFPKIIFFALIWLLVVFVLLTITVNKQTQYALLLLPPIVIVLSYYLEQAVGIFYKVNRMFFIALFLSGIFLTAFVAYRHGIYRIFELPNILVWILLCVLPIFLMKILKIEECFNKPVLYAGVTMTFIYLFSEQYIANDLEKSDIKQLMISTQTDDHFYQLSPGNGAVSFYAARDIRPLTNKQIKTMADSGQDFRLVAKKKANFEFNNINFIVEKEFGDWAIWHFGKNK